MPATWLTARVRLALPVAAALILVILYPGLTARETVPEQAIVVAVTWAACLVGLALSRGEGAYGSGTLYLVIFGLFHGGLLFAVSISPDVVDRLPLAMWLYSPYLPEATTMVVAGMLAFTLALALSGPLSATGSESPESSEPAAGRVSRPARAAGRIGLAVELFGVLLFAAAIEQAGGIAVLADGYGAFLDGLEGSWAIAYGTLLIGIGAVLGVVAGGRWRVLAWATFTGYALVAFPLGTRGSVLFPLAALVAVEARRGRWLRLPVAIGATVVLFALISVVRTTRQSGVGTLLQSPWAASPLDAVAEMGYSLRPSVEVLGWAYQGEPPRDGVTFVAVVLRLIERFTGWHGGPPAVDDRLFNQEVLTRVGPIGGSPIAEGYHNFGLAGVVGVMMVIGIVIGFLSRRTSTLYSDAVLGVVLVPLFTDIRNSSAVVIPQVALGLALVLAARLLAGRRLPRSRWALTGGLR